MKVVFLGSANFGVPTLERLKQIHDIRAVVSTPSRPRGRGLKMGESPITLHAREIGLKPILTPEDVGSSDFLRVLSHYTADIFIVAAFRILPKGIFSLPRLGTLNIHASLLPKYRGPAPIQRAIEAGETETGITIFRIDEGIDTGQVLLQKRLAIEPRETSQELYHRLSNLGADVLIETLDRIERDRLQPISQNNSFASRAPKLTKGEAQVNWLQSADAIFNKIRAFKPFPGTYTLFEGNRLGIEWAEPIAHTGDGDVGAIKVVGDSFFDVQCSPGILRIVEVKPEGRKSMKVHDYLLGNKLTEGARFTWMPVK